MSKPNSLRRWLSGILAVSMVVTSAAVPVGADEAAKSLDFWKTNINANPRLDLDLPEIEKETIPDDQIVRVSIVLDEESTIDAGYEIDTIAVDSEAIAYRDHLKNLQLTIEEKIEKQVLKGKELDVEWNLTLAANIISANVEYGQIGQIKKIKGVKDVILETQYEAAEATASDSPNMGTSSSMIGSGTAYAEGYTGAGSIVAIIDTGIDIDHQSFDADAFEYSLDKNGYTGSLLTQADIAAVLDQLNIKADAGKLYNNSKVPFAYNYVDESYEITHDKDNQGEHGSHVTGIAAANAYIPNGEGGYDPALTSVLTQGVAPDAQVITMKVFGKNGGAYDSDYMAAIEDAIVLGADSINLSLGSSVAGHGHNDTYEYVMNGIIEKGAVVTMSAGNNSYWAESTDWVSGYIGAAYLYGDDVNFATGGSPASYTHSLAIASIDNDGATGEYFQVGDELIFYNQTSGYGNPPYSTLSGKTFDYVVIDGYGYYEEFEEVADLIEGNIAVCYRGDISFFEKANAAWEYGAAGVIVINNQPGVINMDLTGYEGNVPVVSITYADGDILWDEATLGVSEYGVFYGVGSITIGTGLGSTVYDSDYYTMSSFSSWGVPGSLEMKPEITAPGGNIYSVNGLPKETDQYELMSGTSMAAPQVAGMTAVLAQYVRENKNLSALIDNGTVTQRQLIQSLLMSTSEPVVEGFGGYFNSAGETSGYYSILSQGSGLANVGAATQAHSYIMMDENATLDPDSAKDGKVKVELGETDGKFSFTFTINNFSDEDAVYALNTDLFTQDIFDGGIDTFLDTWTVSIAAKTTYGGDAKDGKVTVAAHKSAKVTVSVEITEDLSDYVNGAYVEGFTFIEPVSNEEGSLDVTYSIPILGFCGNWTDPSMFEAADYIDYYTFFFYGTDPVGRHILPYNEFANSLWYEDSVDGEVYFQMGNPYVFGDFSHAAIRSTDTLVEYDYGLIRNAAEIALVITDAKTDEVIDLYIAGTDKYAAYLGDSGWGYTADAVGIDTRVADLGVKNGDVINVSVVAIPEYYGTHLSAAEIVALLPTLGDGAFLTTTLEVDDIAPEVTDVVVNSDGSVTVELTDNIGVAYVALLSKSGAMMYGDGIPEGGTFTFSAEEIEANGGINAEYAVVFAADYANNITTVEFKYGDPIEYEGALFGVGGAGLGNSIWHILNPEDLGTYGDGGYGVIDVTPVDIYAATYADGYIFQAGYDDVLYVSTVQYPGEFLAEVIPLDAIEVENTWDIKIFDMSFNYNDNQLYVLDCDGGIWQINPLTGKTTFMYYLTNEEDLQITSITSDYYGNSYAVGGNADWIVDEETGEFVLISDFALYKWTEEDAVKDTVVLTRISDLDTFGRIAYDLDEDVIYMAGTDMETYYDFLYEIDPATGECAPTTEPYEEWDGDIYYVGNLPMSYQSLFAVPGEELFKADVNKDGKTTNADAQAVLDYLSGAISGDSLDLKAADVDGENGITTYDAYLILTAMKNRKGAVDDAETNEVAEIYVTPEKLDMMVGNTTALTYLITPWTLSEEAKAVSWTSSDTAVVTVNANGVVTAVDEGEAVITVASVVDPTKTATVAVTVDPLPTASLSGLVFDTDSRAYWSKFALNDAEGFKHVSGAQANYYSGTLAVDYALGDTYIYAMDNSSLYAIDPTDGYAAYNVGSIGTHFDYFSDAAPAALFSTLFNDDVIVSTAYGGTEIQIYLTYSQSGAWFYGNDYQSYFDIDAPMAAIAYAGYDIDETDDFPYAEYYFVILENGDVYMFLFAMNTAGKMGFANMYVGSTGLDLSSAASVDGSHSASLHYDFVNDYLYLSHYNGKDDTAHLSLIGFDDEGYINGVLSTVGFGDDVWPVVALYQDEADYVDSMAASDAVMAMFDGAMPMGNTTVTTLAEKNSAAATTTAAVSALPVGHLNAVSTDIGVTAEVVDVSEGDAEVDDKLLESIGNSLTVGDAVVNTDNNTVKITVKADKAVNAMYELAYDSDILTLEEVNRLTVYSSGVKSDGSVVLNFASADPVSADVSVLVFSYDEADEKGLNTEISLNVYELGVETEDGSLLEVLGGSEDNPIVEEQAPVEIPEEKPNDKVEVDVSVDLGGNGSSDAPDTIVLGEDLDFTITPDPDYGLPSKITVLVDGKVLDPSNYTYDPVTGKVHIPGEFVTGAIEVIVEFVPDENPNTAVPMFAILPAIVSGAVLVLSKKRRH